MLDASNSRAPSAAAVDVDADVIKSPPPSITHIATAAIIAATKVTPTGAPADFCGLSCLRAFFAIVERTAKLRCAQFPFRLWYESRFAILQSDLEIDLILRMLPREAFGMPGLNR